MKTHSQRYCRDHSSIVKLYSIIYLTVELCGDKGDPPVDSKHGTSFRCNPRPR